MRISTGQIQQTMLASLQGNYSQFGKLETQMASGKRIMQPSDDPIGTLTMVGVDKEQAALKQFQTNIGQVRDQLSQNEIQVETMTNMMLRLQDLTQLAANGNYGQAERQGMAAEMRQLQAGLVDQANARDENGSYLFAGSQVKTPPVVRDAGGNYLYQGDDYQRQVVVAHGVTVAANDNAGALFFASGNFFQQLEDFITTLETASGNASAAAGAMLDQLAATQNSISQVRSGIGARVNTLDLLDQAHDQMRLFGQEVGNQIESLDYSEAATRMNDVLMALQVTQQAFGKVNSLSLFNYL